MLILKSIKLSGGAPKAAKLNYDFPPIFKNFNQLRGNGDRKFVSEAQIRTANSLPHNRESAPEIHPPVKNAPHFVREKSEIILDNPSQSFIFLKNER